MNHANKKQNLTEQYYLSHHFLLNSNTPTLHYIHTIQNPHPPNDRRASSKIQILQFPFQNHFIVYPFDSMHAEKARL